MRSFLWTSWTCLNPSLRLWVLWRRDSLVSTFCHPYLHSSTRCLMTDCCSTCWSCVNQIYLTWCCYSWKLCKDPTSCGSLSSYLCFQWKSSSSSKRACLQAPRWSFVHYSHFEIHLLQRLSRGNVCPQSLRLTHLSSCWIILGPDALLRTCTCPRSLLGPRVISARPWV